jgi:hypothetical protein
MSIIFDHVRRHGKHPFFTQATHNELAAPYPATATARVTPVIDDG